jgi:hypothetical protein
MCTFAGAIDEYPLILLIAKDASIFALTGKTARRTGKAAAGVG